ncbi:hypothetical protein BGZ47_005906 [Haplosporangium gracile]|nr:hypothetical protein BGZ47_005906 [Haplosporangium gracile]
MDLQDQMVPSWEELLQETERSTMDGSFAESQQTCRVYVLKDVTEMHSLALAARTDALKKERASASHPGLLLLHITRFGTVDHAITIPQQKQHSIQPNLLLNSQDGRMVTAMTNTSVMSYVHPDDTRAFCQGLDRACKALYTVFRVRWRLEGQEHLLDSDRQHFPFVGAKPKEESVRRIEFQGESFEEYVDPTAVPEASLTTRVSNDGRTLAKYVWAEITGVLSNSQPLLVVRPLTSAELFDQAEEASLAIAVAAAAASSSLVTSSRRSNTRGQLIQEKKGWKTKSKRMDLEEGMRMPKQLNLSALTSLSMSGSRHDEMGLRMPGSLPLSISASSQQLLQQPSQQLMAATRCRNPSGHANPMPSFLAFPSNATLPWSGMFVTIALDAWRQWIQTVHAGQAQFRDWCEYLLEATIDQMIESLSLGLTLLGIEEAPRSIGNTNSTAAVGSYRQLQVEDGVQDESTLQCKSKCVYQKTLQPAHAGTTTTTYITATTTITTTTTTTTYCQQQQLQKAARHQQTLSGLNRAGKILQSKYPSIEGIVRNISNSWLGQKIKTRLEQKLDVVADQVVDWWEAGGEVPLPLPLPRPLASWSSLNRSASSSFSSSSGSSGGATVCELDESDGLLMTESSVVVGVPCENNTPILVD